MATNAATGLDDRYTDDGASVINTRVDQMVNWLLNWGRSNSVWYQCDAAGWDTPVANGAGPLGACSAEYSL